MEFDLAPEQRAIQELAHDVADRHIRPRIADLDAREVFGPEILTAMGEAGLLGVCLPEKYGGAGGDYVGLALACYEVERADTAYREILSVHLGLTALGILQWGAPDQKRRYLPRLASGEVAAGFGLTEPGGGSDVAAMATTARRQGGEYVLNGEKMWISYADVAGLFLVFAKTDPQAGHRGITAFVVERGAPGFSSATIHGKLGVRAGNTGSLVFHDCRVPLENRIGEEGEGFKIAMSCLDNGRLTVAAGATGLVRACLDASVAYARERSAFGRPIAERQLVQRYVAHMQSDHDCAWLLTMRSAWMKNQGRRNTRETSLAKWFAADAAWRAADAAVEIHGAYGFSREYPVERYLRNARGGVIYEGTREIHELLQAEYAFGMRRDAPLRRELPGWPFPAGV